MLALTLAQVWLMIGPPIQRPSEGVPLRWDAPPECPDAAALRERVHALVPGLLERPDAAGSRVEVEVLAAAESYAASVVVRNSDGETRREFAAADSRRPVRLARSSWASNEKNSCAGPRLGRHRRRMLARRPGDWSAASSSP